MKLGVKFLRDLPGFVGVDCAAYGSYAVGDTAELPAENALLLISKGSCYIDREWLKKEIERNGENVFVEKITNVLADLKEKYKWAAELTIDSIILPAVLKNLKRSCESSGSKEIRQKYYSDLQEGRRIKETLELEEKTLKFLQDPYLLLRIKNKFDEVIVGETENKLLVYLVGLSSGFDFPLSLILTGESSAGKNWVIKNILDPYLADRVLLVTRGTEAALDRAGKSKVQLDKKILYVVEYKGAESFIEAVKLGISERRLKLLTTYKDPQGNIDVELIDTPAKYSFITTKLDLNVPSDALNRLFVSSCDLSEQQTVNILESLAKKSTLGDDISLFEKTELTEEEKIIANVPNMLENYKVAVLFAKLLPQFFPRQVRARRDWNKLIWLIRVSTLLHQKVRIKDGLVIKVDGETRLVPSLDDILIFLVAMRKALTETFLNLPSYEQDFYKSFKSAVEEKTENLRNREEQFVEPQGMTVQELVKSTGKAQGTVYRYLEDLVNVGLVVKEVEGRKNVYYLTQSGLGGYSLDGVVDKILTLTPQELDSYVKEELGEKEKECEYDPATLLAGIKKSYYLDLLKFEELSKKQKDILISHNMKSNLVLRVFKIFNEPLAYFSYLNKKEVV